MRVVTGVNLAMLLDFVFHRDAAAGRGADRARSKGAEAIRHGLMPIVLCRVDDRLIHGQVVVGWGQPLGIGFIVLVDDEVAASDWEQDLYRMGVPPEIELGFAHVAEAGRQLAARGRPMPAHGIVLTGDVATMAALCRGGAAGRRGSTSAGIHHRPGRTQRLPYVYLTEEEYRLLDGAGSRGRRGRPRRTCRPRRRCRWRRCREPARRRDAAGCCWPGAPSSALDLVSVPQALLRAAAGGRHGGGAARSATSMTGLQVGVLLELFALDVLPVGAARYPDYGPGDGRRRWLLAAGGAMAGAASGSRRCLALLLAVLGGWSLQLAAAG